MIVSTFNEFEYIFQQNSVTDCRVNVYGLLLFVECLKTNSFI